MNEQIVNSYHVTILNHFKDTRAMINKIGTNVLPDVFVPNILFTDIPDNKLSVLFKLKRKGDISFKKERSVYMLR